MDEYYQKIAYIALRRENGSIYINVPLYIRLSEVNPSGLPDTQEQVVNRITEIMTKKYERQLTEYYQKLKAGKKQ